jgi:hypothetical protein
MYSSKRGPMMRLKRAHDTVKAAHDALRIPPLAMVLYFMFLLILFHTFVVNLTFSD